MKVYKDSLPKIILVVTVTCLGVDPKLISEGTSFEKNMFFPLLLCRLLHALGTNGLQMCIQKSHLLNPWESWDLKTGGDNWRSHPNNPGMSVWKGDCTCIPFWILRGTYRTLRNKKRIIKEV